MENNSILFRHEMMNFCKFFKGEINFGDKNEKMFDSLRELVSMLFAVVVGVGLERISDALRNPYPGYAISLLLLAYIAILLSWWGYNFGTFIGPPETNAWNYVIDCVLLVIYWFLINSNFDLQVISLLFFLMFVLYSLWEFVRWLTQRQIFEYPEKIKNALKVNILFTLCLEFLCITYFFLSGALLCRWLCIVVLFIILFLYRYIIYRVYTCSKYSNKEQFKFDQSDVVVIDSARSAALNAKANLSNFKVGAAILAGSGKIYTGCNVEFENYSNTIHAEENAIGAFIAAGEKRLICVAVFTSSDKVSFPCGMCRQSLFELGGEKLKIIACNTRTHQIKTIGELLPEGFRL